MLELYLSGFFIYMRIIINNILLFYYIFEQIVTHNFAFLNFTIIIK